MYARHEYRISLLSCWLPYNAPFSFIPLINNDDISKGRKHYFHIKTNILKIFHIKRRLTRKRYCSSLSTVTVRLRAEVVT